MIIQRDVYADLLFLINFSMDFLCFFVTARILRIRLRPLPTVAASVLGGIYSVASLFLPFGKLLELLCDIAVCVLMCVITFASQIKKKRRVLTTVLVYFAVSAVLGGIMTALFNILNRFNIPSAGGGDNISSWLFLLLASISGIAAVRGSSFLRRMPSSVSGVSAEIFFNGKSVTLNGVTDTGNILRDPISGRAVIITDLTSTAEILPDVLKDAAKSGHIDKLTLLPPDCSGKIRLIPSETVAGSRMLIGIVPDKILIHSEKGSFDVPAIFAPADIPHLPDGCRAIIPGELCK